MPDYFANPAGFFGLLAIPAILAIHLLRERSRPVPVSTLFLLERIPPRTPHGRTIHLLQNSLPLWLQLLIAALATWLLVNPQWVRANSTQQVTLVLDNTASMLPSRDRVRVQLPEALAKLGKQAGRTSWLILTTDRPEAPLYRGPDLALAMAALEQWQPVLPHHDPARAFSLALLESRAGSAVLFVTDRKIEGLPAGVTLVSYGEPLDNCGFAGVKTVTQEDGVQWEAIVYNSGSSAQQREWWLESEKAQTRPEVIRIDPGKMMTLSGPFPPGAGKATIRLSGDAFAMDDTLPIVMPRPKPLSVHMAVPAPIARLFERVITTVDGARRTTSATGADIVIVPAGQDALLAAGQSAIVVAPGAGEGAKAMAGGITPERHSFTAGTVWDGLLTVGPAGITRDPGDQPLLWQGAEPLIFLRPSGRARRLYINFDIERSNADRLPAMVLLLGRFLGDVQEGMPAFHAANFETAQSLPYMAPGSTLVLQSGESAPPEFMLRAPFVPQFFQVRSGDGAPLLEAAAQFGDPREGDFRNAGPQPLAVERGRLVSRDNTEGDPFASVWLLAIGAALAGSWAVQAHAARRAA